MSDKPHAAAVEAAREINECIDAGIHKAGWKHGLLYVGNVDGTGPIASIITAHYAPVLAGYKALVEAAEEAMLHLHLAHPRGNNITVEPLEQCRYGICRKVRDALAKIKEGA